jgi:hypothetical protein
MSYTRCIHVTRYNVVRVGYIPAFVSSDSVRRIRHSYVSSPVRIQHQWQLAILNQFFVLIYAVCHILPSFVSYQGCVGTSMGVWGSMIY